MLAEIDVLLWTNPPETIENGKPQIIGVYTKDGKGLETLNRVLGNQHRMHPERNLDVHTYCTNIPNV